MKKNMFYTLFLFSFLVYFNLYSWAEIPKNQLPEEILEEVKKISLNFENILRSDCRSDKCYNRGCTYEKHEIIDLPETASLPGIADNNYNDKKPPQYILTGVKCEFAYENTISIKDLNALKNRLEKRVSTANMQVKIDPKELPPAIAALKELPPTPNVLANSTAMPPLNSTVMPTLNGTSEPNTDLNPTTKLTSEEIKSSLFRSFLPYLGIILVIIVLALSVILVIYAQKKITKNMSEDLLLNDNEIDEIENTEVENKNDVQQPIEIINKSDNFKKYFHEPMFIEVIKLWLKEQKFDLLKVIMNYDTEILNKNLAKLENNLFMERINFANYLQNHKENNIEYDLFIKLLETDMLRCRVYTDPIIAIFAELSETSDISSIYSLLHTLPLRANIIMLSYLNIEISKKIVVKYNKTLAIEILDELFYFGKASTQELKYFLDLSEQLKNGKNIPIYPENYSKLYGININLLNVANLFCEYLSVVDLKQYFQQNPDKAKNLPEWTQKIVTSWLLQSIKTNNRFEIFMNISQIGAFLLSLSENSRRNLLAGAPEGFIKSINSYNSDNMNLDKKIAIEEIGKALEKWYETNNINFVKQILSINEKEK